MLTTSITAFIGAILIFFGVEPGPYLAGVWIAIKVLLVAGIALLGSRFIRPTPEPTPAVATVPVQEP